jgi:hypothetical protein
MGVTMTVARAPAAANIRYGSRATVWLATMLGGVAALAVSTVAIATVIFGPTSDATRRAMAVTTPGQVPRLWRPGGGDSWRPMFEAYN